MTIEDYAKIILPTPDAFFCRGTNIFAQPPTHTKEGQESDDRKNLIIIPRHYCTAATRKEFRNLPGYSEELSEVFEKSAEDLNSFINKKALSFGKINCLENNVDIKFVEAPGDDVASIVQSVARQISKESGNATGSLSDECRGIEVQAVINSVKAELTLNEIAHSVPRYKNLDPREVYDRFLVEVNKTVQPELFDELSAIESHEVMKKDDNDFNPQVIKYIPIDKYSKATDANPIPNQFLILTEPPENNENQPKVRAYRMKYHSRRFERIDLEGIAKNIEHIWKPRQKLDIRQLLALDILLDTDIKLVYIIGGKQTGKTSLAMAAFESFVFGRGGFARPGSGNLGKDTLEEHITLIKSGLPKNIIKEEDLLAAYTSYVRAYSEQEFLLPFEELLKSQIQRDPRYADKSALTKSTQTKEKMEAYRASVYLPTKAPFVLLSPREEQGMSFTGYTIRDECQNEFPHVMKEFVGRRGPGARYAILGDLCSQINRPGLDMYWNGLLLSIEKNMEKIGKPHVAGIDLTECWSARMDL